jgi:aminoglycoside/choline kinase family phosphotransferase
VFIEGLELSADEDAFARGFAQAVQTMLLIDPESSSSASNAIAASDQTALAAICFRRQQGGNMSALTAIEAESLNNRARVEAFARVDSLLDGSVFNVPDPERLETICNGDEVRR